MDPREKAPPVRTARPEAKNVRDDRPRKSSAALRVVQSEDDGDESISVEGFKPLLPEGMWFEAKFVGHSTLWMFASPKVMWEFEIVQSGSAWNHVRLFRAFRVRSIVGRPAKGGGFKLYAGGDMYQALTQLLDYRQRADRVTLQPLKSMLFRIKVRTVRTNSRQAKLADHAQYSVIDEIRRGE